MKQLLINIMIAITTSSAFAYEKVDGGIKLGKTVYPIEITQQQLSEIDNQSPELIDLLLSSGTMEEQEKVYWLSLLPIMTESQRQQFYDILLNELKQLEQLNQKYQQEIEKINARYFGKQKKESDNKKGVPETDK